MSEDPKAEADAQTSSAPEIDPAEVTKRVAAFEARIEAGEFDHDGFHRAVQQDLFPLLGEGALKPDAFSHLVGLWAKRTHPFDWPFKPFGRLN
jgi:hypothetical protein